MENPVTLVIIGGLVSLVSSLATIALQHWLSRCRQEHETRRYPREVLFNKQTEFYEKAIKVLRGVNEYITTLDVWLRETSPDAKRKVQEYKEKNEPVWSFNELIDTFSMYLPDRILRVGNDLLEECSYLPCLPTVERTERSIEFLLSFQNTIRECVGADKISDDLLKAFGAHERKRIVGDDAKDR